MTATEEADTDTLDPALLRFALLLHAKAEGDDATYARVKAMTADEVADLAHDEPDESADFADPPGTHPPHPGLVYDERSHRYHRPDSGGSSSDPHKAERDVERDAIAEHPDVKGKPGVFYKVRDFAVSARNRVNAFILKHEGAFNAVASVLGAAITTPDDIAKAPWLAGKFGANSAGEQGAGDAFGTATGVPGSVAAKVVASVLTKGLAKLGITFAEAAGDVAQAAELLAGLANAALDGTGVTVDVGEVQAWLADRLAGERTFAGDHEGTWDESKHPRADNGQFGRGSGDGGSGKRSGSITGGDPQQLPKPKPKKSKADVEYATSNSRKQAEIDEVFRDVLGTDDAEEIASVVGAPDDATVSVDWVWKSDQSGKKAKIVVTHAAFTAVRYAYRTPKGNLVIQNDEFFVKPGHQGAGLGADVFAAQVENAIERGAYAIVCHAAKENPNNPDRPHNGYYTWPRFGYDQSLTDEAGIAEEDGPTFAACRERFPDAKTVLDVMASPEGRAWWKDNGTDLLNATFDLREGSRSRAILEAYKAERAERKKST